MQQPASNTLSAWITRRPSLSLLLAGFVFSWLFWLVPLALQITDPVASRHLSSIGAFGPALAAVWITSRRASGSAERRLSEKLEKIGLGFVSAGSVYFICLPYASTLPLNTSILGWVVRVSLFAAAAYVLSAAISGRPELSRLILPGQGASNHPLGYVLAILACPLILLAGLGLSSLGGSPFELTLQSRDALSLLIQIVTSFFYILMFGGALGQEPAWRGMLLSDLQKRSSPLAATFVIGLLSAVWMLPLYFNGFYAAGPDGLAANLLNHFLTTLLIAFPFTWLYNRTRGNLLICILFHASFNTASVFIAATPYTLVVFALVALMLIGAARMWQRLPEF
jgi:uncharacterized protein